ncbi:MAG: hypothetical protein GY913_24240 [Proteobacteria bacterium]|nr:hypothetical protein [Pseudomonadota bacterium]MCP4920025.1 hypothetical protein [Pseudomonadota bacterium]
MSATPSTASGTTPSTLSSTPHEPIDCSWASPYAGDTSCATNLPLLCLLDDGAAAPSRESNWAGGTLEITEPINGCQLDSLEVANSVCEQLFGTGYRTAEFHDGGSWSMTAYGEFDTDERMWLEINDKDAECW